MTRPANGDQGTDPDAFVDISEWVELAEGQVAGLNDLYRRLMAEHRALDALEVIGGRNAVELLSTLMVAVNGHRFDTQHICDRTGRKPPRMADRVLYEEVGLPPIAYDEAAHLAWIEAVKACGRKDEHKGCGGCACSCHDYTRDQMAADIVAVLTVYDEHVAPENRGPWRDRLAEAAATHIGRTVQ